MNIFHLIKQIYPALAEGLFPHSCGEDEIIAITADSRKTGPQSLFIAIKGTTHDGHDYISQALQNGASGIVLAQSRLKDYGQPCPQTELHIFFQKEYGPSIPFIAVENPAVFLAKAASLLAGPQPSCLMAITGTNGKSSIADFLRQLWQLQGKKAASLGTLGLISDISLPPLPPLTTPDAASLAITLAELKKHGVEHVVLEASSHGIEQHRLDGITLSAAGFSNLTRDHLDYHRTMPQYRAAKLALFENILPPGAVIVINADMEAETLTRLTDIAGKRGIVIRDVGEKASLLRLLDCKPVPEGQYLRLALNGTELPPVILPLPGRFQAENALLAAALCWEDEAQAPEILALLARLRPVPGRCAPIARLPNGAMAYVDYAHTPDALARVLQSLRPHTKNRLHLVFGAGGNRDRGKRPLMGQEAARYADHIVITDDNPRHEDPAMIRAEILAGIRESSEAALRNRPVSVIAGRKEAIGQTLAGAEPGDVVLIAGKGHEQGQIIGDVSHPFDDCQVTQHYIEALDTVGGKRA